MYDKDMYNQKDNDKFFQEITLNEKDSEVKKQPEIQVEEKRYGVNKPYRIKIRGKITNDV